ncbi:MAG: hypothetical protein WBO16_00580 [Gammaproteobacteria bacterium]
MLFNRSIFLRTTAAALLVALSNGCAGIHEKQSIARIDKNDESGLLYDVTKKKYSKNANHKNHNINKHDVVNAWGVPVSITKNNFTEMWVYERKMFFGAAWILVPVPIVAWPAGYYETSVYFRALPYIEWVNIQTLTTEVTENTEVFSFVGAASARIHRDLTECSRLKPLLGSLLYRSNQQNKHLPLFLFGKQLSYQPTKSGEDL